LNNTNETELLYERIDELNTTCTFLREQLEQQRIKAQHTIDELTSELKNVRGMVDRLYVAISQGREL
jgi:hypothetical protein